MFDSSNMIKGTRSSQNNIRVSPDGENLMLSEQYEKLRNMESIGKVVTSNRNPFQTVPHSREEDESAISQIERIIPKKLLFKVLIVDDSAYNLFVLKEILSTIFED
jgi:PleD family two-component response regulator